MKIAGMNLIEGAVDCHVHACPHINGRTATVFDVARQAAAAGMKGIGLIDNFGNSSGLAALAMIELGSLGVDVFGGPVLEPCAGGVSADVVRIALDYGYGPGTGARFVSLPTHHARNVAKLEGRSKAYLEGCLYVPPDKPLQDPLPEIFDLLAKRDVVLNTGHVSGPEAVKLAHEAKKRGVKRVIVPSGYYTPAEIKEIVKTGAYAEFSFFILSHAAEIGLTSIDHEPHQPPRESIAATVERVRAATAERAILSGDSGSYVLPPPVEVLRELIIMMQSGGITDDQIRLMVQRNPARLFKVGESLQA